MQWGMPMRYCISRGNAFTVPSQSHAGIRLDCSFQSSCWKVLTGSIALLTVRMMPESTQPACQVRRSVLVLCMLWSQLLCMMQWLGSCEPCDTFSAEEEPAPHCLNALDTLDQTRGT